MSSLFSSKKPLAASTAKDIDKVRTAKQKKAKKPKVKNEVRKVARSVQDTIPYEHVCGKYIFEVSPNHYSVTYSFTDVTYDAADGAEQERIFLAYGDLLNSFDTSDDMRVSARVQRYAVRQNAAGSERHNHQKVHHNYRYGGEFGVSTAEDCGSRVGYENLLSENRLKH